MFYHIISHYITLCHIISHYITLYHIISHYITLYHIISHYVTLYHIISHYITLYHTTSIIYVFVLSINEKVSMLISLVILSYKYRYNIHVIHFIAIAGTYDW